MPNTIHLSGDYTREEALATETIKPGHLLEVVNSAGTKKFQKHATAKGFGARLFAVEDALQGKVITDDYATGDLVSANYVHPGGQVFAFLKAGSAYVIGDKLESAGDGTLQKNSGSADLECLATVEEALDLSASGAVAARTTVRIK